MKRSEINPLLRAALDVIVEKNVKNYVGSSRLDAQAMHSLYRGVLEGWGVAIEIISNRQDPLQKKIELIEEKEAAAIAIEEKRKIGETNSRDLPSGLHRLEDDLEIARCKGKLSALEEAIAMVSSTVKL